MSPKSQPEAPRFSLLFSRTGGCMDSIEARIGTVHGCLLSPFDRAGWSGDPKVEACWQHHGFRP